ncbi:SRPBCC family protein [Massilia sp. YIM B04103]|uniref:SRPBCC family protein n=1 Tax=Massilia sp. YIM B04103 TaxID=2963106 RepID=UPI00210E13AC|nr:SRPBCC family protein [Massilia sp. YIM B04103]
MSIVSISAVLNLPAAQVWQTISGFDSLAQWTGSIASSQLEQGGRLRRLTTGDGIVIVERLEYYSESEQTYTYSIIDSPLPVTRYFATLDVTAAGPGRSIVEWSCDFDSAPADEQAMVDIFRNFYRAALDNLERQLNA